MINKNMISDLRTHQIILDDEGTYQISHNGNYKQAAYWDFRHLDQRSWHRIEYCKHRRPAYAMYSDGFEPYTSDHLIRVLKEMMTRMGITH